MTWLTWNSVLGGIYVAQGGRYCVIWVFGKNNKSLFNKIINLKKEPIEKLKETTKKNAIPFH